MAPAKGELEITPQRIIENLWSARAAQALVAGVELDLFTQIAAGKRTPQELARAAGASERGTEMLLGALVGLAYLNKKNGRYGLEPVAEKFLVSGKETYLGGFVYETKMTWPGWGRLTEVVKSGRPIEAVDTEQGGASSSPNWSKPSSR